MMTTLTVVKATDSANTVTRDARLLLIPRCRRRLLYWMVADDTGVGATNMTNRAADI